MATKTVQQMTPAELLKTFGTPHAADVEIYRSQVATTRRTMKWVLYGAIGVAVLVVVIWVWRR